jgi:hypothetical protein
MRTTGGSGAHPDAFAGMAVLDSTNSLTMPWQTPFLVEKNR